MAEPAACAEERGRRATSLLVILPTDRDGGVHGGCVYGALLLHFDGTIPTPMLAVLSQVVVLWGVCQSAVLVFFRIHRSHWRFTSAEELPRLVGISLLASAAGSLAAALSLRMYNLSVPMPVYLVEALLSLLAFIGLRVLSRLIYGLDRHAHAEGDAAADPDLSRGHKRRQHPLRGAQALPVLPANRVHRRPRRDEGPVRLWPARAGVDG